MSEETDTSDEFGATRRTVLKGLGAAGAATALGTGIGGAAADYEFERRFANPRVREAAKVWARGYRGRRDRTAGVNDSGIDIAHPDLGGWNGVTAVGKETDENGQPELLLTDPDELGDRAEHREQVGEENTASAVLGPGTTVEGSQTVVAEFTPPTDEGIVDMDATLSWDPQNVPLPGAVPILSSAGEDQSFSVQLNTGTADDPDWVTLQTIDTGANPETLRNVTLVPGETHRFVAGQFANVVAQGTVTWTYHTYTDDTLSAGGSSVPFDAKTVGWFDAGARYGSLDAPDDPDGHGSHVAGIVGGTGQASAVADATYDDPRAVLTAGDALSYEVEAPAGTGVFGVATGEGVEVLIEGPDGTTLRTSGEAALVSGNKEALPVDDARVDHPTVHSGGTATYTVIVRPVTGEAAATATVEEVVAGRFGEPAGADGATLDDPSLHAGLAPGAGLVGLQGLSGPTAALGLYADAFAREFNMRTVNMSWGGLVPGGGTVGGGGIQRAVRKIADAGILAVAAAGNNFGTVNTAPAIADEAVSVAATNYVDGITGYTDGGAQAQDEDGGTYGKPDVCAPGGSLEAGQRAVAAGTDRGYTNKAGTSMASPYACGAATLVAEAMDAEYGDAPDAVSLPDPAAAGYEDAMRLKATLLATASSTAFTAAPYHRHAVRYVHDGRSTYQGYGRVNPDAAVDAAVRELVDADGLQPGDDASATTTEQVGLDVPDDSRAVAGHVVVDEPGTLEANVEFTNYAGGNKGMTKGAPHLDLFVYDATAPTERGEPNTVASAQGTQGAPGVSADVDAGVYYVVVKLVNVPGVVNGYDVRAAFDLTTSFTRADLPALSAGGTRSDDGRVFTGGRANEVTVTLDSLNAGTDATVVDQVPEGWTVYPDASDDVARVEDDGRTVVFAESVAASGLEGDASVSFSYFVEAPEGVSSTNQYTFGPAKVRDVDASSVSGSEDSFGGTDTNYVVGRSQGSSDSSSVDGL
jgi:subtilisin family serine protease